MIFALKKILQMFCELKKINKLLGNNRIKRFLNEICDYRNENSFQLWQTSGQIVLSWFYIYKIKYF